MGDGIGREAIPAGQGETDEAFLAGYDPRAFPPFAVTVDVVVMTIYQGRLAVLLVERAQPPQRGSWALPGGFVGEREDLADAAQGILARETGVTSLPQGIHLEQLGTYGAPGRDPRMRVISVAYLALTPWVALPSPLPAGKGVRLWPVEDMDDEEGSRLAFDHARIVHDGLQRARAKLEYTTVALAFVHEPLTIADLRRVYETVWNAQLDPNNFRRSVFETDGFVIPLRGEARREHGAGRGRPAALYGKGPARLLSHVIRQPRPRVRQDGEPTGQSLESVRRTDNPVEGER